MNLWWIGALLAVFGSVASNLGINIQKFSFLENSKRPTSEQRIYTKQPGWALGLSLVIGGSLCDFAALALAAQSIVAPIGSVTLVANMVFAQYWLGETLSRRDMLGTVLIIAGSVLTVAFGDHSDPEYQLSDFRHFFAQTAAIIYALAVLGFCGTLYSLKFYLRPMKQRIVEINKQYENIADTAARKQLLDNHAELQAVKRRYKPWEKAHPFFLCALSGALGAQSVMFGKMVSCLISTTLQGDNQLFSVFPYLFLFSMLFFIFTQIHFLALALSYFDALYCVPIFQCFFILISTVGGATFFQEFSNFSTEQAIIFPLGILVTLVGVFLLAQRDSSAVAPDGRVEGPGAHVMPASLATFFVDIHRHKMQTGQLQRSLSLNWHHGGAVSKVQQDKKDMEQMADKAAEEAKQGDLKLSPEVEASVMREISSIGGAGMGGANRQGHKRDPSNMTSIRVQSRMAADGAASPLGTFEEEAMSPVSNMSADKARRKMKSRSHPTHFVTPSCLLPAMVAALLPGGSDAPADCAAVGLGGHMLPPLSSDARLLPLPAVRHHQHNPSTPIPAHEAGAAANFQPRNSGRFVLRQAPQPSTAQLQVPGDDSGLLLVPMLREHSEPVPRLHAPDSEYEASETQTPMYQPDSARISIGPSGSNESAVEGKAEEERLQTISVEQ